MRTRILLALLFSSIPALYGCSGEQARTIGPQPSEPAATQEPAAGELDIPTPESGSAVLTGTLIQRSYDEDPDGPYVGLRVYLGVTLNDEQGNRSVARVDQNSAPRSTTDDQGRFVFVGLEPGTYILAVLLPPNNIVLLRDPGSGSDMLIELSEGEALDLGVLIYDFPFDVGS